MSTKDTGNRGEIHAAAYLQKQGYEIICTNWQFLHLEIDIAARHGSFLVIAEVKTRSSAFWGEPETFVSMAKQKKLVRAAAHFLDQHNLDLEVRFDVIGILGEGENAQLTHIADAFQPLVK
ncbi:MAG: YraN family protein [Bacteroidia bacterium]|jgi:putative endonuclease|nr:YraN family protein [Bacteroidia bacterium]